MKKLAPIAALILIALVSVSFINARSARPVTPATPAVDSAAILNTRSTQLSAAVPGLDTTVLNAALKGYNKLLANGAVTNPRYLTIVDMGRSSREKRFFLIDMEKDSLVMNTYVSHGKNSGLDIANSFSNVINSEQSSLGFYVTKSTYTGKHGTSLRLSGMEQGFNDNAEKRAIVVHGADYVNEGRVNSAYMGRSQGCPALPNEMIGDAINYMKDGSVLFIYNPDQTYLQGSELLR